VRRPDPAFCTGAMRVRRCPHRANVAPKAAPRVVHLQSESPFRANARRPIPAVGNRPSFEKVALRRGPHLVMTMNSAVSAPTPAPVALTGAATEARALPEGVREGNEKLVLLTPPAGAKVATLIAREGKGEYLRIAISGGGCNGLSYKMKFVPEPKRGDILVRTANTRVVVDSKSALYLKGTHLDYSSALVAGGFKFTNPNAKASCSCGESFSI
jgi:iron-sulfur cluster assembly protein